MMASEGGIKLGALRGDLKMPTGWRQIGRVASLYMYPVKSLAALSVQRVIVGQHGPETTHYTDRQFMVVDRKGKMITARRYPHMLLMRPTVSPEDTLTLEYPGMEPITVKTASEDHEEDKVVKCEVWGEECEGTDLGEEVGEWLSEVILLDNEGGLRLVKHRGEKSTRPDKEGNNEYLCPLEKEGDKPLFADGYPYLLLSEPSVRELNRVMEDSEVELRVEETRFRPNIFIEGDFEGFAEDKWPYVKIGDTVFRNVKLCTRCVFTTVDPETGEKDARGEPFKTLRTFRTSLDPVERKAYGSSPFIGVNLAVESVGDNKQVNVGDLVMIGKDLL